MTVIIPEMFNWGTEYPASNEKSLDGVRRIARQLRSMLSRVPGSDLQVRIDRDGEKARIVLMGDIEFHRAHMQREIDRSNLMLRGIIKDIAEEYQLEVQENVFSYRYILTKC